MISSMQMSAERWQADLLPLFPLRLRGALSSIGDARAARIEEIRIRCQKPMSVVGAGRETVLDDGGRPVVPTQEECARLLESISGHSVYALEDQMRSGFITIRGGYRVGLGGKAVADGGAVVRMTNITGFCIRVARSVKGAADKLIEGLYSPHGGVYNTLVLSPPGMGKTTMLRDIARQISDGSQTRPGRSVCVVDERSEIAACWQGVAQLDVGSRTDVLDGCPKAQGMVMAIRSLSPSVVLTDEIGSREDARAIEEALCCGVSVIASAHAGDYDQLGRRPGLRALMRAQAFERYVTLSGAGGPGTIECVRDERGGLVMARGAGGPAEMRRLECKRLY